MVNELVLPGYFGIINFDKLHCFRIDLNRDDLDVSTLLYYVRKGEYQSNFAFGIFKKEEKFYLVTNDNMILEKRIIIKNYVCKVIKISNQTIFLQSEAIELFLHTLLDRLYIQYGFEKPVDTRTFLGKSSKGKLSDRREIIKSFKIHRLPLRKEVNVYKSVNHSVFVSRQRFIITFLPNYEIYSKLFDLPLTNEDKKEIEDNEEWKNLVFLTPESFFKRFNEYSEFTYRKLNKLPFIDELQVNLFFNHNQLNYPHEIFIRVLDRIFDINKEDPFECQLLSLFKEEIKNINVIQVTLLIDSFNLSDNPNINAILEDYIRRIKSFNAFAINEKIIYFEDIEEVKFSGNRCYIVIIDDRVPGSDFVYSIVKNKSNISKIIKFSTLEKIHDFEEHFLILWLSLQFRMSNNLIWYSHSDFKFENIVSFIVHLDLTYDIYKMSGYILNIDNKNLIRIKEILFSNDKMIRIRGVVSRIKKILQTKYNLNFKDDLFLFDEGRFTNVLIESFKSETTCVLTKRPNTRVFEYESSDDKTFFLPKNGCFIQLFKDAPNDFILVTTGIPDEPENGLPNPLLIQILSNNKGIQNEEILQIIFDLSFYQTESFSKVNVPFLVFYKNRDVFNKIPYRYDNEVPF